MSDERKTILTPELKRDIYHLRKQVTYEDSDSVVELRERMHKIRYTLWKIIRDHKIIPRARRLKEREDWLMQQRAAAIRRGEDV